MNRRSPSSLLAPENYPTPSTREGLRYLRPRPPQEAQPQDWLAPNEILKIIHKLRHPSSILALLDRYGHRKDYKPNEALYALAIDRLTQAGMLDDVEGVMQRIRGEKACRLSDGFFYDVIKVYETCLRTG